MKRGVGWWRERELTESVPRVQLGNRGAHGTKFVLSVDGTARCASTSRTVHALANKFNSNHLPNFFLIQTRFTCRRRNRIWQCLWAEGHESRYCFGHRVSERSWALLGFGQLPRNALDAVGNRAFSHPHNHSSCYVRFPPQTECSLVVLDAGLGPNSFLWCLL